MAQHRRQDCGTRISERVGLRISNVGLGTWPVFSPSVSEEQSEAILKLAIESGINVFDISEAHSGM